MNLINLTFEPYTYIDLNRNNSFFQSKKNLKQHLSPTATREAIQSKFSTSQSSNEFQFLKKYTNNSQYHPTGINRNFKEKFLTPKQGFLQNLPPIQRKSELIKQGTFVYGLMRESRKRLKETMFCGVTQHTQNHTRQGSKDIRYLKLDDSDVEPELVESILLHKEEPLVEQSTQFKRLHRIVRQPRDKFHFKANSTTIKFTNETLSKMNEQ